MLVQPSEPKMRGLTWYLTASKKVTKIVAQEWSWHQRQKDWTRCAWAGVLCRLPSGIGRLQFLSAGFSQADRAHPCVAGRIALNPTPLLKDSRAPRQRRAL